METVVVISHHHSHNHRNHNQYYSRNRSPPLRNYRDINCQTFHSGPGLLPTPLKSPKTPSHSYVNNDYCNKSVKRILKSTSMPIPIKIKFENERELQHFSELWAGPAYSNSPPPSSLPIPRFSLPPKRTGSLELRSLESDIDLPTRSKSAPASPVRERSPSPSDFATRTLRRILNLDVTDE